MPKKMSGSKNERQGKLSAEALFHLRDEVRYGGDVAFHELDRHGLETLVSRLTEKSQFALITAYRNEVTPAENVVRNRRLRYELRARGFSFYSVVAHWLQGGRDAEERRLERAYFIFRMPSMAGDSFERIMFELARIFDQRALIFAGTGKCGVYKVGSRAELHSFGSTPPELSELELAYARHVRQINAPLVFEGIETPTGSGQAKVGPRAQGFRWMP
jgi:hypothetical protein